MNTDSSLPQRAEHGAGLGRLLIKTDISTTWSTGSPLRRASLHGRE